VERKPFLLRIDPATMAALRAWASDDLRSLNGQIEFLLRRALREAGRLPASGERLEVTRPGIDDRGTPTDDAMDGEMAIAVPAMQKRSVTR
jgi:hypothetical protein